MKVKLSVSELQSLFAVMILAAEAIKQNTIPSREGEGKPIMNHREAMFHMINASEALLPYIADYVSTHSRPKAAGRNPRRRIIVMTVSTHSRPKAAGFFCICR